MARIQILELPEGSSDDRPPFVLVVDESVPQRYILGPDDNPVRDYWQDIAATIGACGVIVTPETVDIPANDVPVDPDGYPIKFRIEGDFGQFHEQVQQEVQYAQGKVTRALRETDPAHEQADIACDTDQLAKWKHELTDALGMDRLRDWDDIRNAAAGIRQERDALAAEVERLRAGEEPAADKGVVPTPAQWIWHWNQATPEKRLNIAAQILSSMTRASDCFTQNHEARLADLSIEVERLRAERAASGQPRA